MAKTTKMSFPLRQLLNKSCINSVHYIIWTYHVNILKTHNKVIVSHWEMVQRVGAHFKK